MDVGKIEFGPFKSVDEFKRRLNMDIEIEHDAAAKHDALKARLRALVEGWRKRSGSMIGESEACMLYGCECSECIDGHRFGLESAAMELERAMEGEE